MIVILANQAIFTENMAQELAKWTSALVIRVQDKVETIEIHYVEDKK